MDRRSRPETQAIRHIVREGRRSNIGSRPGVEVTVSEPGPKHDGGGRPAIVPSPARPAPAPVFLGIPAIGVQSPLAKLGLRENRSLEVPPDGPGAPAGWYSGSPSPGETGPGVLLGHVNATGGGPGVFADLRPLKTGAGITVQRADGSSAQFTVTRAAAYKKNYFPTLEVYATPKARNCGSSPATGTTPPRACSTTTTSCTRNSRPRPADQASHQPCQAHRLLHGHDAQRD